MEKSFVRLCTLAALSFLVFMAMALLDFENLASVRKDLEGLRSSIRPDLYLPLPEVQKSDPVFDGVDKPTAKGLVFNFRNKGESRWECEKLIVKRSIEVEAGAAIQPKDITEWCDGAEPPENLVADIADLFAHEIDFLADINQGDSFSVYIQKEGEGNKEKSGAILAVRISTGGEDHFAFYYAPPGGPAGYFDKAGKSLEKLFLKSPLNYRRITSRFSPMRLHPILRIYRQHYGIDYSAPAGTPVSAIGDGKITFAGWKKGYGRLVRIKHVRGYASAYGHLSQIENGLKRGGSVKSGDIIGYVGQSGLATGPHLDFRLYKEGMPVDFLKIDSPFKYRTPVSSYVDFFMRCEFYLSALEVE